MKLFPSLVYEKRRQKLMSELKNGIMIFIGNTESPVNYPANAYHFRQDSNFLYFFGLHLPDLAAIFDVDKQKICLYGDDVTIDSIIWMGNQPSMAELSEEVGVKEYKPYASFFKDVKTAKDNNRKVHYLPPYRAETKIIIEQLLDIPIVKQKESASVDAIKTVVSMREIKDEYEIEQMTEAAAIGYKMQMAAMKVAKPGLLESQISGMIEGIALSDGLGTSFPVICSIRGEILHNHYHGNIMNKGDMLLLDCGAENNMRYCSDFTRTIPVDGVFTQKQKEIYQIVLDANNRAFELVREGIEYREIHIAACMILTAGLKDLDIMKGDISDAVSQGAHALFMPHGLGHMIGLDVHDMEDLGEEYVGYDSQTKRATQFGTAYLRFAKKLKSGFALTIEPGIYFIPALIEMWKSENKFSNFINYNVLDKYIGFGGIRLEDNVLVTEKAGKYIGKRIPITIEEIEKEMNE